MSLCPNCNHAEHRERCRISVFPSVNGPDLALDQFHRTCDCEELVEQPNRSARFRTDSPVPLPKVLSEFELRDFPFPTDLFATPLWFSGNRSPQNIDAWQLRVTFHVSHRDTGAPTETSQEFTISVQALAPLRNSNAVVLAEVRALIKSMLIHELDECILWGGDRVFDPHKDNG